MHKGVPCWAKFLGIANLPRKLWFDYSNSFVTKLGRYTINDHIEKGLGVCIFSKRLDWIHGALKPLSLAIQAWRNRAEKILNCLQNGSSVERKKNVKLCIKNCSGGVNLQDQTVVKGLIETLTLQVCFSNCQFNSMPVNCFRLKVQVLWSKLWHLLAQSI